MYNFRKSKKGFTLIELMIVVVIIGVLALMGLRLYLTQIAKGNNALIQANAGTVQTTIQSDLADEVPLTLAGRWIAPAATSLITESGIHNPMTKALQAAAPTSLLTAAVGEVWVFYSTTDDTFYINGRAATNTTVFTNVYTTNLVAKY